jgi:hypothetical protein
MSTREIAEQITAEVAKICGCNWESCTSVRTATTDAIDAALTKAIADERGACAQAAKDARLPKGYQWGHDAMEQFNFGKERAALAIEKRK